MCGVDAGHVDAAGVRLPQSDDALDERRLAGAIGAEQAEDLPPVDVQRDAAYGVDGAVRLGQIADRDGVRADGLTVASTCR